MFIHNNTPLFSAPKSSEQRAQSVQSLSANDEVLFGKKEKSAAYGPKPKPSIIWGTNQALKAISHFFNLEVTPDPAGVEKLKEILSGDNGLIITPNHSHLLDVAVAGLGLSAKGVTTNYMAADFLFANPLLRFVFRRYGAFSVDRGAKDKTETERNVLDYVSGEKQQGRFKKKNTAVTMFPEGYISNSNLALNPLKDGAAMFAIKAYSQNPNRGMFIAPTGIYYDYEQKRKMLVRMIFTADHLEKWLIQNRHLEQGQSINGLSVNPPPKDPPYDDYADKDLQALFKNLPNRFSNIFEIMVNIQRNEFKTNYPELALSDDGDAYQKLDNLRSALLELIEKRYETNVDRANISQDQAAKRLRAHLREMRLPGKSTDYQEDQQTEDQNAFEKARDKQTQISEDMHTLKRITQLTLYPPGYLDPNHQDGDESELGSSNEPVNINDDTYKANALINRMIEQATLLSRDLTGKFTPVYRINKGKRGTIGDFIKKPIYGPRYWIGRVLPITSLLWTWKTGEIEANLKIADPINVGEFINQYYSEKKQEAPTGDALNSDKALKKALTAEITKRMDDTLKTLEQSETEALKPLN